MTLGRSQHTASSLLAGPHHPTPDMNRAPCCCNPDEPVHQVGLVATRINDCIAHFQTWVMQNKTIGIVLNSRTTGLHKCAAVPRRARIQGSWTYVSLNFRLESNKEEEEEEEDIMQIESGVNPQVCLKGVHHAARVIKTMIIQLKDEYNPDQPNGETQIIKTKCRRR